MYNITYLCLVIISIMLLRKLLEQSDDTLVATCSILFNV